MPLRRATVVPHEPGAFGRAEGGARAVGPWTGCDGWPGAVEQEEQGASEPELSEDHPCYGFRALENPEECTPPEGDMGLYPSPAEVAQDEPQVSVRGLLGPRTQVLETPF